MTEKWPPLDPGTRVRTTSKKTADREWMPEALAARKWGVTGTIIMHHDSHGLCYDVRHDDGTEGCYDPNEFEVMLSNSDKHCGEKGCGGEPVGTRGWACICRCEGCDKARATRRLTMDPKETANRVEDHAAKFIQAMLMRGLDGFPADHAKGVEVAINLARELVDQINKRFR